MIAIELKPNSSMLSVEHLSDSLLSSVANGLTAADVTIALERRRMLSRDLTLFTKSECKSLTCNNNLTKPKGVAENVRYSAIDRVAVVFGSRFSMVPTLVSVELYSKHQLQITIKCHTEPCDADTFKITPSQTQILRKLISTISEEAHLASFDQQLEGLASEISRACELLSFKLEPTDKFSPREQMDHMHLLNRYFVCAIFATSDPEMNRLIDHMDIVLTNVIRSALTFPGLLEKTVVNPLLLLRTGKIYDFLDDIAQVYFAAISSIVGVQEDSLTAPDTEGMAQADVCRAHLSSSGGRNR